MLISIGIKIHSKVALKLWCCFWCIFTWNCVSVKHNPSLLNKFTLLIISSECFHNDLMFSNVKATLSLLVCRINDKLSLYYIPYSFLTFWFNFMGFRWYFPTRCMFSNFDILINGTYIWLWFKFLCLWSSKLTKTLLNWALELYVLYLPKTKLMQISPFDGRMWLFVLLEMMIHTFE